MRKDAVTPEIRMAVFARDGMCVLARIQQDHVCRDRWGQPHRSTDIDRLTLEHVHDGYGLMGKRAPSDMGHMVAMCHAGNVGVPSKADRAIIRDYLARVSA